MAEQRYFLSVLGTTFAILGSGEGTAASISHVPTGLLCFPEKETTRRFRFDQSRQVESTLAW